MWYVGPLRVGGSVPNVGNVGIFWLMCMVAVLKIEKVRPMATNELLTLVDGAVAMLSDARVLAIEAHDPDVRLMLSNVIMQIEAHRPDLEQKSVGCVGCPQTHRLER